MSFLSHLMHPLMHVAKHGMESLHKKQEEDRKYIENHKLYEEKAKQDDLKWATHEIERYLETEVEIPSKIKKNYPDLVNELTAKYNRRKT